MGGFYPCNPECVFISNTCISSKFPTGILKFLSISKCLRNTHLVDVAFTQVLFPNFHREVIGKAGAAVLCP